MRLLLFFFYLFHFSADAQDSRQPVWLDADTGNEMDDLYAIVRLINEKSIKLIGLSSAHFNNADLNVFEKWNAYDAKTLRPVDESQRLNEIILNTMGRKDILHPLGADRQIGRAWGGEEPRDSKAAREIIKAVKELPTGIKLHVLTLGPLTNMATALILDPSIKPFIRCFSLGAKYDPKTSNWNKSEFNIRNDLNAFDYLLNLEDFDFTIMPLEASFPLQFHRQPTYDRLNENVAIEKILEDRWKEHNPQDEMRVMWDLALIEAYLHPELSSISTVRTPPENKNRTVRVYTKIDENKLAEDFWETLKR